jgi:integrase
MNKGITTRHNRACPAKDGGRCICTPTFQAQVWDADARKRISKTFSTKTAAKQWRSDAQTALRKGELSGDRGPLLKDAFEDWLDGLRAGHIVNRSGDIYKPAAIRNYERDMRLHVLPVLGHLRLSELTTRDVQRLVDKLIRDGLAPATINVVITPLRAMCRRAAARGQIRSNPTIGVEKPAVRCKPRRVVAPEIAEAMIAALPASERALWATAIYAGLRRGELAGLRREDIDLANGIIHVRRGWDAKDGEITPKSRQGKRRVPLTLTLRDYLDEHLLNVADGDQVFGSFAHVEKAGERARKHWNAAGLEPITLHEARYVYASFAIAAGFNAKALSTYMGHANVGITHDLYGHLLPGNESEAAGLLDAYLASPTAAQTAAHPEKVVV